MKKLLVILILISPDIFAQDILKDQNFNNGLYSNFYSFRTNSPDVLGDLEFVSNEEGKVNKILINGDSVKLSKILKEYWGFCKDDIIYVNVSKQWQGLGIGQSPKSPYYPISSFGYYCLVNAQVSNSGTMTATGYAVGGIIGGIIAGAIASTLPGDDLLLFFDHQNGNLKSTSNEFFEFALIDTPELREKFKREEKLTNSIYEEYLNQYNEIKSTSNNIYFDNEDYLPVVSIIRETKNQLNYPIEVFKNGLKVGVLDNESIQVKESIENDTSTIFLFKVKEEIRSELMIELPIKGRGFYKISHSSKESGIISIKEIDATKTRYFLQMEK